MKLSEIKIKATIATLPILVETKVFGTCCAKIQGIGCNNPAGPDRLCEICREAPHVPMGRHWKKLQDDTNH